VGPPTRLRLVSGGFASRGTARRPVLHEDFLQLGPNSYGSLRLFVLFVFLCLFLLFDSLLWYICLMQCVRFLAVNKDNLLTYLQCCPARQPVLRLYVVIAACLLVIIKHGSYFSPGRVLCLFVCLSVCLFVCLYNSKTTGPNFSNFYACCL